MDMLSKQHSLRTVFGLLFALAALNGLALPTKTEAQNMPHFGTGVALVTTPAAWDTWATLSPAGDFVAGGHPFLYLWDIRDLSPNGNWTRVAPVYSNTSQDLAKAAMRFSPDGRYLAVQSQTDLRILTVPNMQTLRAASVVGPAPWFTSLAWTPTSRFVSTLSNGGQEALVLDIQTGQTYRYTFQHPYDHVYSFGDQWLIAAFSVQSDSAFALCDKLLESCTPYPMTGGVLAVAPHREIIITERSSDAEHRSVLGAWQPRSDGIFLLNEQRFTGLPFSSIRTFSPSERFLAGSTGTKTVIFDFDSLAEIYRAPLGYWGPTWLDDGLFVSGDLSPDGAVPVVALYDLEQSTPLDTLALDQEAYQELMLPEAVNLKSASDDGRWLLFNLGRGALLIPIVYE